MLIQDISVLIFPAGRPAGGRDRLLKSNPQTKDLVIGILAPAPALRSPGGGG